jgi:hypothetical protein
MKLPQAWFGKIDPDSDFDWRKIPIDGIDDDDDEELAETPQDVIDMLGFDPLDLFNDEEEVEKFNPHHDTKGRFSHGGGGGST